MALNKKSKGSVRRRREDREHEEHREKNAHTNWMGGPSYAVGNPLFNLRLAASSCFFGEPMYYHKDKGAPRVEGLNRGMRNRLRKMLCAVDPQEWREYGPTKLMETAIDAALDHDVESTLKIAAHLRNEDNIRTTPQVIMVRAAHHDKAGGTGLVRKYAPEIIKRADEPSTQLAYQLSTYGRKKIPNSLKRSWRDRLQTYSEYQLAKYKMGSREVKTVDVMNLVHPKSDNIDRLARGELKLQKDTWEALISEEGSNTKSWTQAVEVMGHMALLRNLRNLIKHGVDPKLYAGKLVEGAAKGRQLPFRYLSAHQAIKDAAPPSVLDAVEESLEISLGNLPHFAGRVMSLCDNSGSAQAAMTSSMGTMPINHIANLTGVLTGRVSDEGWLGVFGDYYKTLPIRQKASIFDQAGKANTMGAMDPGATEHGIWLFWDKAIKEREHWDHVFIYSDMQAGHGGLYGRDTGEFSDFTWRGELMLTGGCAYIDVPKLIAEYRDRVNPDVNVYCVQVAGYQNTIIPEFYHRTYILGGWSAGLLRFAAQMSAMNKNL